MKKLDAKPLQREERENGPKITTKLIYNILYLTKNFNETFEKSSTKAS